ncbi:unnamed protein product [Lymnaea stagnalis]|uniref:G-protein coupled receptors family 1 profile domain-containing protein n=1 Tax=Lymnaea stagnalis TaxID=6523 RepID=A0AAV2HTU5_LYMST
MISFYDHLITMGAITLVRSLLCVFGIIGNVITIKVFLDIGVKNGVTASFLFLSCADLAYLVSVLVHSVAYGLHLYEEQTSYRTWFAVKPFAVFVYFANVASCPYMVTVLTTMFLSVVRCLGVSQPLRFRSSITRTNALWVLFAFLVLAVGSSVPLLAFMGIVTQFDERINMSRPSLWVSPLRQWVKDVTFVVRDAILPLVTELVLSVCVVVMATSLRSASKFRSLHASESSNIPEQTSSYDPKNETRSRSSRLKVGSTHLRGRDLQVVQQMLLLSAACLICHTPKITYNCVKLFLPDISDVLLANGIRDFFQSINCSVTFLIYNKFNSKFHKRVAFKALVHT